MAKSCNREICYFPHPFSSKQHQNLFTSEILPLKLMNLRQLLRFKDLNSYIELTLNQAIIFSKQNQRLFSFVNAYFFQNLSWFFLTTFFFLLFIFDIFVFASHASISIESPACIEERKSIYIYQTFERR